LSLGHVTITQIIRQITLKPTIQLPMEGYGRLNMGSRIKYQWRGMEGLIWGLIILIFHDSAHYKSTIQMSIKEWGMEGLIWGLIILIFHDSTNYKFTIQMSIKELIWVYHFYFS
jgi:hypothetical protein